VHVTARVAALHGEVDIRVLLVFGHQRSAKPRQLGASIGQSQGVGVIEAHGPRALLLHTWRDQHRLARKTESVDLDKQLRDLRVALRRPGKREVANVDAERVRLCRPCRPCRGRRPHAAQRIDAEHAHHQRRPTAPLGLQGQGNPDLISIVAEQVGQVDEGFAQLSLRALRCPPLEDKVDVRVLVVPRLERLLQLLLRAAPRREADAVAVAEVERGRVLLQRLGLEVRRVLQARHVHLHEELGHRRVLPQRLVRQQLHHVDPQRVGTDSAVHGGRRVERHLQRADRALIRPAHGQRDALATPQARLLLQVDECDAE